MSFLKSPFYLYTLILGSTQGRICCLLEDETDNTKEDIFKRNILSLALCFLFFIYNVYFSMKIKKYLLGQCPNMSLSFIGKYPRNVFSYKASSRLTSALSNSLFR